MDANVNTAVFLDRDAVEDVIDEDSGPGDSYLDAYDNTMDLNNYVNFEKAL